MPVVAKAVAADMVTFGDERFEFIHIDFMPVFKLVPVAIFC